MIRFKNRTLFGYIKFVDRFFYGILICQPFSVFFLNRDTGEGAFIPFLILIFCALSIPVWRFYYREWSWAIALNFIFVLFIAFRDVQYFGFSNQIVFTGARQLLVCTYYMLVIYNLVLRDYRKTKVFIAIIVISAMVTAMYAFLGVGVETWEERGVEGERAGVLGQNANATSRDMAMALLVSLSVILGCVKIRKFYFWPLIGFIPWFLHTMLRVASRGGIVFLMAALPFSMLTVRTMAKRLWGIVVLAMGVMAVIMAVLSSDTLRSRILNTYYDRDTGGREFIAEAAIRCWKESPVVGRGLLYHRFVIGEDLHGSGSYIWTHCTYTFPLASGGVIGAFLYYTYFIVVLISAWKVRKLSYGGILFLITIFVLLAGITANIEFSKANYIAFGCALALAKIYKKNKCLQYQEAWE